MLARVLVRHAPVLAGLAVRAGRGRVDLGLLGLEALVCGERARAKWLVP